MVLDKYGSLDDTSSLDHTATFVVAASDSSSAGTVYADYLCDGTADDVTINAAIDALPAGGGKVVLLEGTYTLAAVVNLGDNTILEGQGTSTLIKCAAAVNISTGIIKNADATNTNVVIRNMRIDSSDATKAEGISLNACAHSLVENVWIDGTVGTSCNGITLSGTANNIWAEKCTYTNVVGCHVTGTSNSGIQVNGKVCRIEGNHVYACAGNGITFMDDCHNMGNMVVGNVVVGNTLTGIYSEETDGNYIAHNFVYKNGQHGIALIGASYDDSYENYSSVYGNYVAANSQTTDDTYNNIHIVDGLGHNVQNNTCRKQLTDAAGQVNLPKYGIYVLTTDAAYTANHLITNNDLLLGGKTGAYQDDGVGTNTTAGNRVA